MTTTEAPTLTAFILAREGEWRVAAAAAIDPKRPGTHWQWVRTNDDVPVPRPTDEDGSVNLRTVEEFPTTSGVGDLPAFPLGYVYVEVDEPRALPHIAMHDPARVLRQCDAIRAIVALDREPVTDVDADGFYEAQQASLRALASIWSDHADYRQEWPA